ncbi:MAG: cytochrome P450 [Proteobacteria bacterium]|nr:cytochrome P450 [Pseudomonadota bacterium]
MKKTSVDPIAQQPDELLPSFARLRREGPLHETESGQFLVVSQAGVRDVLQNVDAFVGTVGDVGELADEDTMLAGIPEPRHGRIRKIVNSALAYHHASKVEPFVRELAKKLMDDCLARAASDPRGEVELMELYARKIPSAVIARILGVPSDDFEIFAKWSDEVLAAQGSDDSANRPLLDLHPEFARYLEEQVSQRVTSDDPPNDVITRLLQTEVEGERLTQRAVCTQAMFLIIAGNETTRNLIGNILRHLAAETGLVAQLAADRALIPPMIEETLRLDPPVQLTARTCTRAIDVDGVRVEPGDRLILSFNSANRDEKVYPDPEAFRLDRQRPRDHVAFGAGPHVCPGAYLARLEAQVALETLVDAVAELDFAVDYTPDPNPVYWAHGPRTLRVALVPRHR